MNVAYVATVVNNISQVISAFETCLKLRPVDLSFRGRPVPAFQVGQTKIVLLEPGSDFLEENARTGVHHIAIAADDPLSAAKASGLHAGPLELQDSFGEGARVALPKSATGGLLVYYATPLGDAPSNAEQTERIDHLGVVTPSNESAKGIFCGQLGLEVESFQTDIESEIPQESFTSNKYGVVYITRPTRLRAGIKGLFVSIGDFDLEFLESFDPGEGSAYKAEGPGHTRQDHSAISRFLAARGPGLHHIAFKVRDINAVLSSLKESGHRVIDTVGRPGGRRSLIGFVHPEGMGGVLVHFVQREEI